MPTLESAVASAAEITTAVEGKKKAVKKASAKKVEKKGAKKAAPKKAAAKEKKAAAPKAKKEGLRKPQIRILEALVNTKAPNGELTRVQISEAGEVDLAMLNSYIGSSDDAVRAKNDEKVCKSLITLGYVTHKAYPTESGNGEGPVMHKITAAGKKALENLAK